MASQSPARMNQMTLPMNDAVPAVGFGTTTRPKGHTA